MDTTIKDTSLIWTPRDGPSLSLILVNISLKQALNRFQRHQSNREPTNYIFKLTKWYIFLKILTSKPTIDHQGDIHCSTHGPIKYSKKKKSLSVWEKYIRNSWHYYFAIMTHYTAVQRKKQVYSVYTCYIIPGCYNSPTRCTGNFS